MLPQEIVDIILGMVDAEGSLKACALVSRSLCAATQRILFRSLELKGHGRLSNYTGASKLFGGSSHIGAYVKDVKIDLPVGAYSDANKAILPAVLAKLTAVRRCRIDGGTQYMWDSLCDSTLVAFLARRPLQSLSLRGIKRIPLLVLAPFVASVPILSFTYVTLRDTSNGAAPLTNTSSLTDLVLDKGTEDIITCLFSSSPARALPLQRLSVRDASCLPLIVAAAPTLRYLRIGSPVTKTAPVLSLEFIPSLPSLRSFELEGDSDFVDPTWLHDTITSILRCKPPGENSDSESASQPLQEIVITYLPAWKYTRPGVVYGEFLAEMDRALSSHVPVPRLRWKLRFVGGGREDRFARLVDFIRARMPRLGAAGRLVFESYEPRHWNDEFL